MPEMAACASCGTENPSGNGFCRKCGAALKSLCSNCGAPVDADDAFCGKCGTPLGEPAGEATPSALGFAQVAATASERRVCSVLFADLVGFTSLSESRDPEDVRAVLSRYFEVARTVIIRYGGVVEKFIGDAVMAVWGTPTAKEGDTERAVRAALELVSAVDVLGSEVGAAGLSARAGVVTGEVAVTLGASGEGMVAGDAVNTASRVQAISRPGTVFADETSRRLSASSIAFEDEGSYELKGKELPEQLYRAVRVLSGVGGSQRADGLEAPFTGREAELRLVKEIFHSTVTRRSAHLVVVSGPAGVGKSRLGWEFEKYCDGLADTVLWHKGRCLSYGEGVAFWALAEIVRRRFGIAEEDSSPVASQKLREGLVRFVTDESERDYVGPRLARLLGVEYPSEQKVLLTRDELFAGWRLFFERLAGVAPVIMLVEDAQHADAGLLEFFEHLIDWSRDLAIFVLLFARPGLDAIDSGYGMGRNRSTLALDPLDNPSMEALVDSLVPAMPRDAKQAITTHAQGIPLFAVETIRSLVDSGVVTREGDTYRLVGDLGPLSVPDSLHALLAARLDALSPEVRVLVADASVLGTSFQPDALVAVSNQDAEQVSHGLADLVRRDVLQVSADPLSPERGSYSFSQEMLRQVAYQTLSRKDRKSRHLAVAAHLRSVFANDGEEISEIIARHYLDALAAQPDDHDAKELAATTTRFLVRAAERASRSGAPARAASSYAEAAALSDEDRLAAELWEKAARESCYYGDFEASAAQAGTSRERYTAAGDDRGAARAQACEAEALASLGRFDEARREVAEALELLRPEPDRDTVDALKVLSNVEHFSGHVEESDRVSSEALWLGQAVGVGEADLASLFSARGLAARSSDRYVESAAYRREALRLAEEAGDLGQAALALINLSDLLAPTKPREAAEAGRRAAEHSRRTGRRSYLGAAVGNLVLALFEVGEWDEAEAALTMAFQGDRLDDDELLRFRRGCLDALRGDGASAAAALEALPKSRASEGTQDQGLVAMLQTFCAMTAGNDAEVLTHSRRVLELGESLGVGSELVRWAWPMAARAARALGEAAAVSELVAMLDAHPAGHLPAILRAYRKLERAWAEAAGASEQAVGSFEEAITALKEVGNPYELAQALIDHATWLAGIGETARASAALDEARETATRLRCPPLRLRADSVAARSVPAQL